MTYRLLLVDDEPAVTDWLMYLLSDTFGGLVDIYRFNESAPAMRFMEENPFDVAVLDINMPVTDGMALLKLVSLRRPEARVVFLTGFDQFEYARNAVNPQVTAYILKNEEDSALLDAIRLAMRQIDEECRKRRLMELAQRRMDAAGPALRREYLMRLIWGTARARPGFPVKLAIDAARPFCLLCCEASMPGAASPADLGTAYAAGLAVEDALDGEFVYESAMPDGSGWVWLLQPKDGTPWSEEHLVPLRAALEASQLAFNRQTGGNLCFLHPSGPVGLDALAEAYSSLRPLRALAPAGGHAVLTDEAPAGSALQGREKAAPGGREPAFRAAQALRRLLEQGEREEFMALLEGTLRPMAECRNPGDPVAGEIYLAVSAVFLAYINRMALADRLPRDLSVQMLCQSALHGTWLGAAAFLSRLARALFAQQASQRESRAATYVQKARKYISDHLDEDLSLISVADRLMLNPSYFSSLFKSTTGVNLSDHIKSERIARAKALLAEKKHRINEIARMTGYANPAYFTRFFKNETGLSPVEYRNGIG